MAEPLLVAGQAALAAGDWPVASLRLKLDLANRAQAAAYAARHLSGHES